MKNNYYDIKRRNKRKQNKIKRNLNTGKHISKINKLTPEEKRKSNYRKRQAKKLNYKKVFFALVIFILLIYLVFSGFSKLVSKIKKPNKIETSTVVEAPKDITINMAVIRRYYVPFNQLSRCI